MNTINTLNQELLSIKGENEQLNSEKQELTKQLEKRPTEANRNEDEASLGHISLTSSHTVAKRDPICLLDSTALNSTTQVRFSHVVHASLTLRGV